LIWPQESQVSTRLGPLLGSPWCNSSIAPLRRGPSRCLSKNLRPLLFINFRALLDGISNFSIELILRQKSVENLNIALRIMKEKYLFPVKVVAVRGPRAEERCFPHRFFGGLFCSLQTEREREIEGERERILYRQPTGPDPLCQRDGFSGPASPPTHRPHHYRGASWCVWLLSVVD